MDKIVMLTPLYLAGSAAGLLVGYFVWLSGRSLGFW
ncbi:hypothetical protein GGR33_003729 [Methylobacterium brachythecii]|uniref:Uncharacterized protein n=1 Tax=Methylobacterium brachythecii TaxID=1176177 RepID=A0A7W6AIY7_9HYPH|nr:hypothetical protein [Methylobacterium brachythecii]